MTNSFYKLGIVDDHQIVIDGLVALLKGEDCFQIEFTTTFPDTVPELLAQHQVDILLTDVMMPVMPGNVLAKIVKQKFPSISVLALSMSEETVLVQEMIAEAHIEGYALKNIGKAELVDALKRVARGGAYFSDAVIESLKRGEMRKEELAQIHLTDREVEIIRLIEKEFTNKQIAEQLFISERTVETHRKNIFRKTGANGVLGLVKFAHEHGILK